MTRNEVITVIEDYINHICKEGSFDMEDEIEFRELLDSFLLSEGVKEKYPVIPKGYTEPVAAFGDGRKYSLLDYIDEKEAPVIRHFRD
jgi:hypothetical protein